jgi:hypothetical protein
MNRSQKIFVGGLVVLGLSVVTELGLGIASRLLTSTDPLTPDQAYFDLISSLGWLSMVFFVVNFLIACIVFVIGWRSRAALTESTGIGTLWKVYRILFIIFFVVTVVGFGTVYFILSHLGPVR